jgi:uncharacterized OB-fold protein
LTVADTTVPTTSIQELRTSYESGQGLRGFRSACGFVTVTWGLVCPACGARDLTEIPLSGAGRLAAFSVQNVPSDEFLNDAPYAYVVVDLAEGGRATGWIDGVAKEADLAVGAQVQWVASYKPGVHFRLAADAAAKSP